MATTSSGFVYGLSATPEARKARTLQIFQSSVLMRVPGMPGIMGEDHQDEQQPSGAAISSKPQMAAEPRLRRSVQLVGIAVQRRIASTTSAGEQGFVK